MSKLPERWYCVSSYGIATLCKDEEDARATARHCDLAWPKGAPHRAILLGDVAAAVAQERERCAKICDVTPPFPFRPSIEAAHAIRLPISPTEPSK